jgi:hypothetical protein
MKNWCALLGIGAIVLTWSLSGAAHHGQVGLFDQSKIVELKGAVKKWSFVNPHPILQLEVTEGGKAIEWDVYFGPSAVSYLRRQGFAPDTFRAGEIVVVRGYRATSPADHGIDVWGKGTGVTRADGRPVPK